MMITQLIAQRLHLRQQQVENTVQLLEGGATIPFISRYRKEATGGMDEVQVAAVKDEHERLLEVQHRREFITNAITEQGKMTPELQARLADCWDATVLEDIYLPFKPKRKTRAEVARRLGLEPLADLLQTKPYEDPVRAARRFLTAEVPDEEAALQGARDILAERINENEDTR